MNTVNQMDIDDIIWHSTAKNIYNGPLDTFLYDRVQDSGSCELNKCEHEGVDGKDAYGNPPKVYEALLAVFEAEGVDELFITRG